MKGIIIFINSSPKPKKWFDISSVATRLDSNQKTLRINKFYIIALMGITLFQQKTRYESGL